MGDGQEIQGAAGMGSNPSIANHEEVWFYILPFFGALLYFGVTSNYQSSPPQKKEKVIS